MRRNVEEIKNELDLVQKEMEHIDDINMVIEQKNSKITVVVMIAIATIIATITFINSDTYKIQNTMIAIFMSCPVNLIFVYPILFAFFIERKQIFHNHDRKYIKLSWELIESFINMEIICSQFHELAKNRWIEVKANDGQVIRPIMIYRHDNDEIEWLPIEYEKK